MHSQHCAPYKGCANVQCERNINKNNIYVHDNDNVCTKHFFKSLYMCLYVQHFSNSARFSWLRFLFYDLRAISKVHLFDRVLQQVGRVVVVVVVVVAVCVLKM